MACPHCEVLQKANESLDRANKDLRRRLKNASWRADRHRRINSTLFDELYKLEKLLEKETKRANKT